MIRVLNQLDRGRASPIFDRVQHQQENKDLSLRLRLVSTGDPEQLELLSFSPGLDPAHFTWGLSIHWWSTILAVVFVMVAAWTHTWKRLLIATGVAILLLMLRRDVEKWAERKSMRRAGQSGVPQSDGRDGEHAP